MPPFRVYICVVRNGKYRKLDTVPCFCWSGSATDDGAAASASDAAKPDDTAHVTGTPTNRKKHSVPRKLRANLIIIPVLRGHTTSVL